jgi:organic radical activating enzyme
VHKKVTLAVEPMKTEFLALLLGQNAEKSILEDLAPSKARTIIISGGDPFAFSAKNLGRATPTTF